MSHDPISPRGTGTGPDIYLQIDRGKTRTNPIVSTEEDAGKSPARNTRGFFHNKKLAGNSFNGACACAGTAVNANVSIDFALAVSVSSDSAQGAGFFAYAAANAQILVDGMSHNDTST